MSAATQDRFEVEVVYARAHTQRSVRVSVVAGESVRAAVERSGLLQAFPEIDLQLNAVGIWGKPVALTQPLRARDRVEIYRPLQLDPKEARRTRAQLQARARTRSGARASRARRA